MANRPGTAFPKRLIVVDLPIKRISEHARPEKTTVYGNISTLHVWWARRPHPQDPQRAIEVRFIEVKGRAIVGEIALSTNEYKTAERLKKDYWLCAVFNCGSMPEIHIVQDPVRLGWEPIVKIEHYRVAPDAILAQQ
jgi:hypothetical protein